MTGALKGRDMEMENTQREDMTGMVGQENMAETAGQDMTETAGQEEEIQLPQKKGRKERKGQGGEEADAVSELSCALCSTPHWRLWYFL